MTRKLVVWGLVVVAVLALGLWLYSIGSPTPPNPPPPPPTGSPSPGPSSSPNPAASPARLVIGTACVQPTPLLIDEDQKVMIMSNGRPMKIEQKQGDKGGLAFFPVGPGCSPATRDRGPFNVGPNAPYTTNCGLHALPTPTASPIPGSNRWSFDLTIYAQPGGPSPTPTPCVLDPNICVRICN